MPITILLRICLINFTVRRLLASRPIRLLDAHKSPLGLSVRSSANLKTFDALDLLEFGQILYDFMGIEQLAI